MAEGTSVNQDNVVCRFFMSSVCRDGDRCLFSHDRTRRIPDSVCRFYLQDKCIFGERCRYDHIRIKNVKNSKSQVQNDSHTAGPSCRSVSRDVKKNTPRLTVLNNSTNNSTNKSDATHNPNWINAPEFVPKTTRSYADTVKANTVVNSEAEKASELCPYFILGECPFGEYCPYIHGEMCDLCSKACLHPMDEKQRKSHIEECEKELEKDMELSFAIQRSMDKTCGICMDVVLEKMPVSERRFGILEKCNHIYCLSCIRKWRRSKQFENNQHIDNSLDPVVTRACPECRIASDFITPSLFVVDTEEERIKLITEYKKALSEKPCKYFRQGEGTCPFGGACFYLHAKPDGTKVDLPLPTRRRRQNQNGESSLVGRILLWDYLELREDWNSDLLMQFELDDFMLWSDSDDDNSDISDSFLLSESF